MNRLTVALSCLSFAVIACNSGSGTPTLTALTSVSSDAKCPSGGVTLTAGPDKNGNGKLDTDEVNQTQEICNGTNGQPGMNGMNGMDGMNGSSDGGAGTNGATSLVKATALPAGDTHCTMGGTQLDFGLDNGAGGGTANDGILQTGEILNTSYVCNGSLPYYPDDVTPPAAPAGQFAIRVSGGDGVSGAGGSAAGVSIALQPGSLGGGVKVFNTGKVDASFTVPTPPAFVAGAHPLTVSADLTLNPYADVATGLASNDVYFRVDNDLVYQNVNGAAVEVTSLSVAAGKTLTLPVDAAANFANIGVRNDIHNAGTIQVGAITTDLKSGASFVLFASNFYQDAAASLITKGLPGAAGSSGGHGGTLTLHVGALFINQGTIDTSGGDGDSGGQGGAIDLISTNGSVYNTGAIATFGGIGNVGNGGLGGQINIGALLGVFNSHRIDSYGGSGVTGGGNCQGVTLETSGVGAIKNGGAINAYGGSCTTVDCNGGSGCPATLIASGGDLTNDAAFDVHGGDGVAAGGSAGSIDLETSSGSSFNEEVQLAAGSIQLDGDLIAVGGQGSPAGNGGSVTVQVNPNSEPVGQKVELFGYTLLEASGGKGDNAVGGNAGTVDIYAATSFPSFGESNSGAASGPVVNYAKLTARGGDGTQGGSGGSVYVQTQLNYDFKQPLETALNFGDVDVSAGAASSFSQFNGAGFIYINGVSGMENHGALKALGGSTSGGPIGAGAGGNVSLSCESGPAKNTGAIDVSGGGSSGIGGGGGEVDLYGVTLNNSGALSSNGGNAAFAGGAGGYVTLQSAMLPSTNTGTLSAAGGTGTPAGAKGYVLLDGVDVTP